ncbi:CBS domain-containing protein [Acidianus sulfidivorans JP7]|uniref:CBS domain-containing protein n=1 Tax=Acidianus sulfidivorans JP7 TaxID=619593 RepID=A0A2U9ILB4_9CREN|nr:CBS domain-containing protein [Acidianus sulfidivorans]AWR96807.1 CBS domain-containing protein [Acidianus sulfidivorans JP7]
MELSTKVSSKNSQIIRWRDTVSTALHIMNAYNYNVLVVVDDNEKPLGTISLENILKHKDENLTVDKVMDKTIVTITGKEDPLDLFVMMMKNKLNVVVETDKNGRLKKIITLKDIFRIVQEKANKD